MSTAGGFAEALALAGRETFDVLISDLGLQDGNGCELMARMQKVQPLPGIAMSGHGTEEVLTRTHEAGFAGHLVKPVELPQLLEAISRIMQAKE